MMPCYVSAADIRLRHSGLHQKLRAFRLAVDDHFMNLQVRAEHNDLIRPTSSVFRTPHYVTVLGKTLETELGDLRLDATLLFQTEAVVDREAAQLEGLVAGLEKQFRLINRSIASKRLSLSGGSYEDRKRIRSAIKSARKRSARTKVERVPSGVREAIKDSVADRLSDQIVRSVRIVETEPQPSHGESESVSDSCSVITLPKLDPEKPTSQLPVNSKPPEPTRRPYETRRRGILKREGTRILDKPKPEEPQVVCPETEILTSADKRKRVTFSNSLPDDRRGMLRRQKSNLGYPYGSSFPTLPPLPSRRRFTRRGSTLESLQLPIKDSLHLNKEKTWLY